MRKKKIPKINSIDYGGKWIGLGLLAAVIIPGAVWIDGRWVALICLKKCQKKEKRSHGKHNCRV